MVNTLKTPPTILGIKMPRHFLMLYIVIFSACTSVAQQNIPKGAEILMQVYPDFVKGYNDGYLLMTDGTKMLYDDGRKKTFLQKLDDGDPEDMFAFK